MSERVNAQTDACTHGPRLESHPISAPRAFSSGELIKIVEETWRNYIFQMLRADNSIVSDEI